MARRLPVGIQSFKDIRTKNFLYVDKTMYIWKLINSSKSYFLSRPRRFGKSLFISTLESYFSGERELFTGLYIEEKENEKGADAWAKYPVISFYLSGGDYNSPVGLSDTLGNVIDGCIVRYGLDKESVTGETLPVRFKNLIQCLYEKTGRQVVVLVDEYDKPLLSTMISNTKQEEENRQLYKGFFSVLKDMDGYLKFVFFTGVTKFSKVSIFSDLNQLKDISMDKRYSGICGITEDELTEAFEPEIGALTSAQGMTHDECMSELAKMYDGYHFSAGSIGVYN
ncbi:MAG: AAA family ATPase, partial [Lachnospiraceae bacterium]|nr:AAA family ATPase [Lachnospiraceae bacterium]